MKKGTLLKKGKYWSISNTEYKDPITLPGDFGLNNGMEGKEVEFDNAGGPIKLIRHEGTDYVKKDSVIKGWRGNEDHGNKKRTEGQYRAPGHKNRKPARAPYNFIPLNREVAPAQHIPDFDKFEIDRMSGYIDLAITNETPFFIRGRRWDDEKRGWIESEDFFNWQNGRPVIPGSSLRGMVRALMEAVSWSKMEFTDKERKLFHRGMFQNSLKEAYQEERRLINRNSKNDKLMESVGLLKYEKGQYVIYPSRCLGECHKKYEHKFSFNNNNWEVYPGKAPGGGNKGWKISLPAANTIPIQIPDKVVKDYQSDETRGEDVPNVLKCAREKNEFEKHIKEPVPENIKSSGVPVFYQENRKGNNNIITSFGQPRNYRIAYTRSIGDHVIQDKWSNAQNTIDIASAIFGWVNSNEAENSKATRVFFEDGYAEDGYEMEKRSVTLPLLGPKPTTFQHYLEQPDGVNTESARLVHWGDRGEKAPIRGFKNYWHRQTTSIPENQSQDAFKTWVKENPPQQKKFEKEGIQQIPINAIKKAVFHQRIRFENLSKEELGCLLLVLDLQDGMRHKLGLGKPLGLGSIHMQTVKLLLTDRKERYCKLFNDAANDWNLGEKADPDLNDYKEAFVKYMARQLNKGFTTVDDFWKENDRMLHLKTMLTFDHKIPDWLEYTRYMEIEYNPPDQSPYFNAMDRTNKPKNEYKDRPVLPYPEDVIKTGTYKPLL